MALVPFRVSGAAADQTLEHRLFQIGQHTLRIAQDVHKSSSLQSVGIHLTSDASSGKEQYVIVCSVLKSDKACLVDVQTLIRVMNI